MSNRYRLAEQLLFRYPVNTLRLHSAILELRTLKAETDCHAQAYSHSTSNPHNHSDPVSAYHSRLETLETRIAKLIRATDPVSVVRASIKNSDDEIDRVLFFVMELYYFECRTVREVAFVLRLSESTINRRKDDLVGLVMYEMAHAT